MVGIMPIYVETFMFPWWTVVIGGCIFTALVLLSSFGIVSRKKPTTLAIPDIRTRWKTIVPIAFIFGCIFGFGYESISYLERFEVYPDKLVFIGTNFFFPARIEYTKDQFSSFVVGRPLGFFQYSRSQSRVSGGNVVTTDIPQGNGLFKKVRASEPLGSQSYRLFHDRVVASEMHYGGTGVSIPTKYPNELVRMLNNDWLRAE